MKKNGERQWRTDKVSRSKVTLSIDADAIELAKGRSANISKEAEEAIKAHNDLAYPKKAKRKKV